MRTTSNGPNVADASDRGWFARENCTTAFATEVFGRSGVGVLQRLEQPPRPARPRAV